MAESCLPSLTKPMSFLYLDIMANNLYNETEELLEQFDTKLAFINKLEQDVIENSQNLSNIDECIDTLKSQVAQIEVQVDEHETQLVEAERFINCVDNYAGPSSCCDLTGANPHTELLKLIVSADFSAQKFTQLKQELEDFNKEAEQHRSPWNVICKIMDYHCETLNKLEQRIKEIQWQVNTVQNDYQRTAKDLDLPCLLQDSPKTEN